jgi:outer membrane autotransporter protein
LSNGNYAISWALCTSPTCGDWIQVFSPEGQPASGQIVVSQLGTSTWQPVLAALPNGAFTAIWNSASQGLMGASFRPDGSYLEGPKLIDGSPPLRHFGSATSTSQGALLVHKRGPESAIYGTLVSPQGSIGTPFFVVSSSGTEWRPSVATLKPDLIALTWGQFNNQPSFAVLLNGAGQPLASPFPLGVNGNDALPTALTNEFFVVNVFYATTQTKSIKLVQAIPGRERVIDVSLLPTTQNVWDFFHLRGTDFFVMLHKRADQPGLFAQAVDFAGTPIGPNAKIADIDIFNFGNTTYTNFSSDLSPEGKLAMVWQDGEGRILTGVLDAYAVMSEALLKDIFRASAQTISAFATGDLVRNQFLQRMRGIRGDPAGNADLRLDLARTQLASAAPTSSALASAAASALALGDGVRPDVELANGFGLFFAGDTARFENALAGGIGTDEATAQALTAGLDYRDCNGFIAGVAASHLGSDVAQDYGLGGRTTSDGVAISAFMGFEQERLSATAYASGARHSVATERNVSASARAIGETNATQLQAGAALSYEVLQSRRVSVDTVGGLHYMQVEVDAYTETGAGALMASVASRDVSSLRSQLGAELHLDAGTALIVPTLRAVWNHEFMDDTHAVTAGFAGTSGRGFTTDAPRFGTDWATIGFGISGRLGAATDFYLRVQQDFGREGAEQQEVAAAVRFGF